jgi:hypothetical protein
MSGLWWNKKKRKQKESRINNRSTGNGRGNFVKYYNGKWGKNRG